MRFENIGFTLSTPAPPNQYHWTHLQFSPTFLHFIQFYPRQVLLTSFSPPKTLSHKTSCFMGSFLSPGLRRVFMFSIYFLSSARLVREGFNVLQNEKRFLFFLWIKCIFLDPIISYNLRRGGVTCRELAILILAHVF